VPLPLKGMPMTASATSETNPPRFEFFGVKPLPLPEQPYSKGEIEDYAWRFFNGEDKERKLTKAEKAIHDKYKLRFIDFIARQPNWLQVMVIEYRVPVRVGKREVIKLDKGIWGYASPDTLNVRLPESLMQRRGDHFEHYLAHELAHNVDNILGLLDVLPADHQTQIYYSDNETSWFRAMERDLTQANGRSQHNLNHGLRRALKKYDPETHAFESFAFVMSYYLTGHFRLMSAVQNNPTMDVGAEQANLNATMYRFFPAMWASFEQEIKPRIETTANDLYESRKVRQWDSARRREEKLRDAMEAAIAKRGWPAIDDANLVHQLANGMNTDWQYFFESLQHPIPPTIDGKLRAFLPQIFDPRYRGERYVAGEIKRPYMLSDFPHLRREIETFVVHIDHIAKHQGIAALVEQCEQLKNNLDAAVERYQKASRAR
jgi:hypothetical protein